MINVKPFDMQLSFQKEMKKEAEAIGEVLIAENFLKYVKEIKQQIYKSSQNKHKTTPGHMIAKLLKTKENRRIKITKIKKAHYIKNNVSKNNC